MPSFFSKEFQITAGPIIFRAGHRNQITSNNFGANWLKVQLDAGAAFRC
jgi:hypothetical protein